MKTKAEMQIEMRVLIARKYRTQRVAAKVWGCSQAMVSAVLEGRKLPTESMLEDAGYQRIDPEPYFVKMKKEKKS
jgi:predicted transcriptional regulator